MNMTLRGINKDLQPLIRAATRQGWQVRRSNNNHLIWVAPSGARLTSGTTPNGGRRSTDNFLSRLKKAGLIYGK